MIEKRCNLCGEYFTAKQKNKAYCRSCGKEIERRSWSINKKKKRIIVERGNKCERCGAGGQLHAHHIKAKASGGDDSSSNIMLLCATCHRKEHKK